jgi:hypothetical protein
VADIEDRLRAALRKQAEAADRALSEFPTRTERTFRPGVKTVVAAVTAGTLVAGVTAAGIWIVRNRAPQPADQGGAGAICQAPAVAPRYLPWLEPGEPVPPPEVRREEGREILVWFAEPEMGWDGPYVTLSVESEDPQGLEPVEVRGATGYLTWVGDPGVGALSLRWSEAEVPCGTYHLSLGTKGLPEARAEEEILRIAESLGTPETSPPPGCPVLEEQGDLPESYLPLGKPLGGDMTGDGTADRATILGDEERPPRCRYFLRVEDPEGADSHAPIEGFSIRVRDLPDVPALLMAVEIDGEPGLEVVVDFGGPMHPHRSGQIFTFDGGSLVAMRTERPQFEGGIPIFFPLHGEDPASVDCAGEPGTIVVTTGSFADGGNDDRHYDITRTFYRASGALFVETDRESYTVEVGSEVQRWPEVADDPFRSCPGRVG